MRIGFDRYTYKWIEDWARIPDDAALREGWAHHGFACTSENTLIGFHPGKSSVLVFDQKGVLSRDWPIDLAEGHGLTLCHEDGEERLWVVDNGSKKLKCHAYDNPPGNDQISGRVVKFSLEGKALAQLQKPLLPVYEETRFSPTAVVVNEEVHGGNGDVWVADGYGAYLVHRFDGEGHYLSSLSGEEGAGRFDCPHGIFIDRRKPEPELYVADRSNGRFQVYDLEGVFKRVFGSEFLTTPSAMVTYQDVMVVAELRARLTLLDIDDRLLGYLGDNEAVSYQNGWPNTLDDRGQIVPSVIVSNRESSTALTVWEWTARGTSTSPSGSSVVATSSWRVARSGGLQAAVRTKRLRRIRLRPGGQSYVCKWSVSLETTPFPGEKWAC